MRRTLLLLSFFSAFPLWAAGEYLPCAWKLRHDQLTPFYANRTDLGVVAWAERNEKPQPVSGEPVHIAVLVPVYREWNNGNLERLLQAFAEQKADPSTFELVFLVNNTPEVAAEPESEIFQDNLQSLRHLQDLAAKEQHPKIQVLDGMHTGMQRNIGALRAHIADRYLAAYRGDLSHLVLAQFDADTLPPPDYIPELQKAYRDPEIVGAITELGNYLPPGEDYRVGCTYFRRLEGVTEWSTHFAMAGVEPICSTPRVSTRATDYVAIDGMPHISYAEDVAMLRRMRERGKVGFVWNVRSRAADRARPDGYDAASRQAGLAKKANRGASVDFRDGVLELLHLHVDPDELRVLHEELYLQYQAYEKQRETFRRNFPLDPSVDTGPFPQPLDLPTKERGGFWSEEEVHRFLKSALVAAKEAGSAEDLDDRLRETILALLSPLIYDDEFASYLGLFSLSRYFHLVRSHPDRFPSAHRFLKKTEAALTQNLHTLVENVLTYVRHPKGNRRYLDQFRLRVTFGPPGYFDKNSKFQDGRALDEFGFVLTATRNPEFLEFLKRELQAHSRARSIRNRVYKIWLESLLVGVEKFQERIAHVVEDLIQELPAINAKLLSRADEGV